MTPFGLCDQHALKTTTSSSDKQQDIPALAEGLRDVIGKFVRAVRTQADTPTIAQAETLAHLERNGPASIAALAETRGVKHQSMRLVVGKLEEDGLVTLVPNPSDGRSSLVKLTKPGYAQNAAARAARTRWLTEVIATQMSSRERAVLAEAIPILQKISALSR